MTSCKMAATEARLVDAATEVVRSLGYAALKPKQMQVVSGIISGRDVFAILPTGFGKSLCFACLPGIYDRVMPLGEPSIVLVLTPLTAIMKDQVRVWCTA